MREEHSARSKRSAGNESKPNKRKEQEQEQRQIGQVGQISHIEQAARRERTQWPVGLAGAWLRLLLVSLMKLQLGVKLREIIFFLQIVTSIPNVYALAYPPDFLRFIQIFSFLNLEEPFFPPLVCMNLSFLDRMRFVALGPLAVVPFILLGSFVALKLEGPIDAGRQSSSRRKADGHTPGANENHERSGWLVLAAQLLQACCRACTAIVAACFFVSCNAACSAIVPTRLLDALSAHRHEWLLGLQRRLHEWVNSRQPGAGARAPEQSSSTPR